jgi:hypothetical protein
VSSAARAADLAYRALYRGLLARLPERAAVPLGQAALRVLPLDRLALFRNDDPRLAITLGGVRLPNPLILSSMYYDTAILRRAMGLGFGAVTAKSITARPRPGHPPPNLVRHDSPAGPGLVNCNGFHNPGLAAYRVALAALPHRVPLIVAAAGESIEEYVEVVSGLDAFGDLVEINISSPNTQLVYEWSQKPSELRRLFGAVRGATRRPVIVKISPDFHEENLRLDVPMDRPGLKIALIDDAGVFVELSAGFLDLAASQHDGKQTAGQFDSPCRRKSRQLELSGQSKRPVPVAHPRVNSYEPSVAIAP